MAIQYGLQRRDFVAANGENQHQGHFSRLKASEHRPLILVSNRDRQRIGPFVQNGEVLAVGENSSPLFASDFFNDSEPLQFR